MSGDLQAMRDRAVARRLPGSSSSRLPERFRRRIEANERKKAAAAEAAQKAALEQQKIDAQIARDKLQQEYNQANTLQRALIDANRAENDFYYRTQLTDQDAANVRQRDELRNRFEEARQRQLAADQAERDQRMFEFGQQEDATRFQQQLERDDRQNRFTTERDQLQNEATLRRDMQQFGMQSLRDDRQQQNLLERDDFQRRATLERDALQDVQQRQRDERLFEYDQQAAEQRQRDTLDRDALQNQFTTERDLLRNEFDIAADERRQDYNRESMYQREAADISARWQDQINAARNAGMQFSERQRQEMREMDSAFRKNVLNGPYDETLKQQAMVEHQKKLYAIIPEEPIQNPVDMLQQNVIQDERNGMWFRQSRDSRGFVNFEPIGSSGGDDGQMRQQQEMARKAEMDRLDRFNDMVEKLATDVDPVSGEPRYKNRDEVLKEAMDRFAPYEQHYRQQYGLPAMGPYQQEANDVRAAEQQRETLRQNNPYRTQPENTVSAVSRLPQSVTSKNVDQQITRLTESGDNESAAALQAIKEITAKYNGAPPRDSDDYQMLIDAMRFVKAKGVSLEKAKPARRRASLNPRDYDNLPGNF